MQAKILIKLNPNLIYLWSPMECEFTFKYVLKLGGNYICNPKALFAKYLLCYFDFLSLKANSLWNNLCAMINLCTKMASNILLNWYLKRYKCRCKLPLESLDNFQSIEVWNPFLNIICYYLILDFFWYKIDLSTWYKPKKRNVYTNHLNIYYYVFFCNILKT